jgi:hypothetical protein
VEICRLALYCPNNVAGGSGGLTICDSKGAVGLLLLSWLLNNWFGILGVVIGVWVSLALRPRPRLRFWTIAKENSLSYILGATSTSLNIRNVGNQPIDGDQWRTPLSVECQDGINQIDPVGVSRNDIEVASGLADGQSKEAWINISRLDPGDEVAFEIQHNKTVLAPQLHGELYGYDDSIARGVTLAQRCASYFMFVFFVAPMDYVELSSIAWLKGAILGNGGIVQDGLFLLASPFFSIFFIIPNLRRRYREKHPVRYSAIFLLLVLILAVLRVAAFISAWLEGSRLWFPQFAIYAVAMWVVLRIAGVKAPTAAVGLTRDEIKISPVIVSIFAALGPTVFAGFVIAGASPNILVAVALVCMFTVAGIRLDRHQLRQRVLAALGSPRGRAQMNRPSQIGASNRASGQEGSHSYVAKHTRRDE